MRSTLIGLASMLVKTVNGMPRWRAAYAMPCPKLPAVAQTSGVSSVLWETKNWAPRPLNERIGFSVSILSTSWQPKSLLSAAASNCGESRKQGSMTS